MIVEGGRFWLSPNDEGAFMAGEPFTTFFGRYVDGAFVVVLTRPTGAVATAIQDAMAVDRCRCIGGVPWRGAPRGVCPVHGAVGEPQETRKR